MWQTKYASAVSKNSGLGVDFWPVQWRQFPHQVSVVRGLNNGVKLSNFGWGKSILGIRAAMAAKEGKVRCLPRFWVSIPSYKKQPVKNFLDRILDLVWLKFAMAALGIKNWSRVPNVHWVSVIYVLGQTMEQSFQTLLQDKCFLIYWACTKNF